MEWILDWWWAGNLAGVSCDVGGSLDRVWGVSPAVCRRLLGVGFRTVNRLLRWLRGSVHCWLSEVGGITCARVLRAVPQLFYYWVDFRVFRFIVKLDVCLFLLYLKFGGYG